MQDLRDGQLVRDERTGDKGVVVGVHDNYGLNGSGQVVWEGPYCISDAGVLYAGVRFDGYGWNCPVGELTRLD